MSELNVVGEQAKRDNNDEAARTRAPSSAISYLPQPGLVAVPGLRGDLPQLRRRSAADELGGATVSEPIVAALRRRRGRGTPLQGELAAPMEQHFGMDLSAVRVHEDPQAGQIARSLQATAFTHGSDIYFAPGAYRPGSPDGQRVLAHEMSHVVAQRTGADGAARGALTVGRADDPAEKAADRSADRALAALRRTPATGVPPLRAGQLAPEAEQATRPIVPALRRSTSLLRREDGLDGLVKPLPPVPGGNAVKPLPPVPGGNAVKPLPPVPGGNAVADVDDESVMDLIKELFADSKFYDKSNPEDIQAGFDLWFGVREGNAADVDVTKKRQAAGEVYGGGGASVTGRVAYGSAEHELPFGLTIKQYEALVQLSAIIGVQGVAKGQLRAKLGDKAFTKIEGAISGFAGAKATAQASGNLSMVKGIPFPVGVSASGSASAFAGAKSDGNATFTLAMNPAEWSGIGADIGADYDAKAGAWADADGTFVFDPVHGLIMSGSASAFAGVSGEVGISGSAKLYGRKAFTVSTSVKGSAGVGGEVKGGFSLKGGQLTLKAAAEGAMGPGMGGGFGLDVNFKPFAVLINREIAKASWKALAQTDGGVIAKATDPAVALPLLESDVRPRLEKYRDFKVQQLRLNQATDYVKMENIQMIIDEYWPRTLIKVKNTEIDNAIVKMLEEVFGAGQEYDVYDSKSKRATKEKIVVDARVVKGELKVLQFVPRDIASILGGTVGGKHNKGENANAAYSPHGLAGL